MFCLALASTYLLRVDIRGRLSSHIYPSVSITVRIPAIGFLGFYRVRNPTPWTFGKILEGSALPVRVSARFLCVRCFQRGCKFVLRPTGAFRANFIEVFVTTPLFSMGIPTRKNFFVKG